MEIKKINCNQNFRASIPYNNIDYKAISKFFNSEDVINSLANALPHLKKIGGENDPSIIFKIGIDEAKSFGKGLCIDCFTKQEKIVTMPVKKGFWGQKLIQVKKVFNGDDNIVLTKEEASNPETIIAEAQKLFDGDSIQTPRKAFAKASEVSDAMQNLIRAHQDIQ